MWLTKSLTFCNDNIFVEFWATVHYRVRRESFVIRARIFDPRIEYRSNTDTFTKTNGWIGVAKAK